MALSSSILYKRILYTTSLRVLSFLPSLFFLLIAIKIKQSIYYPIIYYITYTIAIQQYCNSTISLLQFNVNIINLSYQQQ